MKTKMEKCKCVCCGKVFKSETGRDICDVCFYAVTNYNNDCFYEVDDKK